MTKLVFLFGPHPKAQAFQRGNIAHQHFVHEKRTAPQLCVQWKCGCRGAGIIVHIHIFIHTYIYVYVYMYICMCPYVYHVKAYYVITNNMFRYFSSS